MWYMYNKWNFGESKFIFGDALGEHIWNKFVERKNDVMLWYSDLDIVCRNKIVERALKVYEKYLH